MRLGALASSSLVVLACAAPASAAHDSLVTLGIGTQTVVEHAAAASPSQPDSTMAGQGFSARLRLIRFLGAEASYQVTSAPTVGATNVARPVYQLSGLLYLYSGEHANLALVGGLGATQAGDLFASDGKTTSYHGGLAVEIAASPHWTVAADGRINVPSYSQVMSRMSSDTSSSMTSYYNFHSWQVALGVRYYL